MQAAAWHGCLHRVWPPGQRHTDACLMHLQIGRSRPRSNIRRKQCVKPAAALMGAAGAQDWGLWALLAGCGACGQILEQRTTFGALLSAPLLSMMAGLLLATAEVLPTASPAYGIIFTHLMPLGAALYLLESDLRQLAGSAGSTLVAFVIGAIGTVAGTLVAWLALGARLGPDGWKVASALCASYVGGSVNFAATSQSLGLTPGPVLAASMAADNIAMAIYLTGIMLIPAEPEAPVAVVSAGDSAALASLPGAPDEEADSAAGGVTTSSVTTESVAAALAAAVAACWSGSRLAEAAGMPDASLAAMALVASLIASCGGAASKRWAAPGRHEAPFAGAESLGSTLMLLFFATIGAGAGSLSALRSTGWLTGFILILLVVHLTFALVGGRLVAGCSMRSVLTASNANIGGPATAAAMAASRGWKDMVRPAMLTGSLGYSIGTALGCAVGQVLQRL